MRQTQSTWILRAWSNLLISRSWTTCGVEQLKEVVCKAWLRRAPSFASGDRARGPVKQLAGTPFKYACCPCRLCRHPAIPSAIKSASSSSARLRSCPCSSLVAGSRATLRTRRPPANPLIHRPQRRRRQQTFVGPPPGRHVQPPVALAGVHGGRTRGCVARTRKVAGARRRA